jgi:hypothetical protein
MAKVRPYHTVEPELPPERNVYHDHDDCYEGKKIQSQHWRQGDALRPRCKVCIGLG